MELFLWQQLNDVKKAFQTDFGALFRSKGAAVEAFARGEVPFTSYTEEATAAKRWWCIFASPLLGFHNPSLCDFFRFGHRIVWRILFRISPVTADFNVFLKKDV